jgi:hypothetical protein
VIVNIRFIQNSCRLKKEDVVVNEKENEREVRTSIELLIAGKLDLG